MLPRLSRRRRLARAALAVLAGMAVGVVAVRADDETGILAGAYSEAQAIEGQSLYYEHCLACHGEQMTGLDQAPPLAGPQFGSIWEGETLWSLVSRIDTMPPTNPGSLTRTEAVAVLAYMLWYNGLPLGQAPLSESQSDLAEMQFRVPPPAGR